MKIKSNSHFDFAINKIVPKSKHSNSHFEFLFNQKNVNSKHSNSHFEFLFNQKNVNSKRSQISFEYLIIMGFVTFVIIGVLAIAVFYSSSIKDRIKVTQMTNCANKIISTAESVFYAGEPSRATIICQLSESIQEISVQENSLVMSIQTSSGLMRRAFTSNVNISQGDNWLTVSPGIKKIKLVAGNNNVTISRV